MEISSKIAYRIYNLKDGYVAIAFNILTKKYMFLDGLSAELLQLYLLNNNKEIEKWAISKEIDWDEIVDFYKQIKNFGFFQDAEVDNSFDYYETESNISDDKELSTFMEVLHNNGLFYQMHIDLTNQCNERCIHCYHTFDKYDYSKELTTEQIKHLIDTAYNIGVFYITLSGGECMLRNDFFEILSYISQKNMLTTIFTNGILLSEKNVKQLLNYRVKNVSISIYADIAEIHDKITTIKGSFKKTISGIELLKKYNLSFEIKSVVLKENIDRVEQMRKLSRELNYGQDCKLDFSVCGKIDGDTSPFLHKPLIQDVKKIYFSDPNRFMDINQSRKRTVDTLPCNAGKFGIYCSADGNIYPCVSFRLYLCRYTELLQLKSNSTLKTWLNTKISDFSDCMKHDYCKYCYEQCAGDNLTENGDYRNSKNVGRCEEAKLIAEWFKSL